MFTRIKISIIALFSLAMPLAIPAVASAQTQTVGGKDAACAGVNLDASAITGNSVTCDSATTEDASLNKLVKQVINVFTWVVGVVAVIMIIVAGFRYVVSGGDSGGVTGAKNTILYAIVGLIVVIMAQVIVRFVLNNVG